MMGIQFYASQRSEGQNERPRQFACLVLRVAEKIAQLQRGLNRSPLRYRTYRRGPVRRIVVNDWHQV